MVRTTLINAVLIVAVACGGCSAGSYAFKAQADFALDAPAAAVTALDVAWRNGAISVRGDAEATRITATGSRYARAGTPTAADAALSDTAVTLAADARDSTTLRLAFDAPPDGMVHYGGAVEIVVPPNVMLAIKSSNGKIELVNMAAAVHVAGSNGAIRVLDHVGDVDAETSNGAVRVVATGGVGVKTSNGTVMIESASGSVAARSSNGRIQITANPPADGVVTARTSNGGITLDLPRSFGADVELNTSNGRVAAELSGFAQVGDVTTKRTHTSAKLNGGGGRVSAETSNGNITLKSHADGE